MPRPPKGIEGRALLWRWMATEPPCSRWTSWGKRHGETLRSAAQMRRLRRLHGAARVESPRGRPAFARCSGPSRVPLRHPRGDSRHRVRSRSLHRQGAAGGVAVPVLHRAEAAVGPRRSATRLPGVSEPVGPPRLHLSIMRAIAGALVRVRSVRRMLREPRLGLVPASGLYGGASRRGAWATDGTVLVLLQHQRLPDRRTAWWPLRAAVSLLRHGAAILSRRKIVVYEVGEPTRRPVNAAWPCANLSTARASCSRGAPIGCPALQPIAHKGDVLFQICGGAALSARLPAIRPSQGEVR